MPKQNKPHKESTYILRHWQDAKAGAWKLSLKNIETREQRYFPRSELFFEYFEKLEKTKKTEAVSRKELK